jgi:hypothetical protein
VFRPVVIACLAYFILGGCDRAWGPASTTTGDRPVLDAAPSDMAARADTRVPGDRPEGVVPDGGSRDVPSDRASAPAPDQAMAFDWRPIDYRLPDRMRDRVDVGAVGARDGGVHPPGSSDGPCMPRAIPSGPTCPPGWSGTILLDAESVARWSTEADVGATGTIGLGPGFSGQGVRLSWNLGSGNWVRAKHTFTAPVDLSGADLFGVALLGGGAREAPNDLSLLFADTRGVVFGVDLPTAQEGGSRRGINQIDRWLPQLVVPKKAFGLVAAGTALQTRIDWTRVNRFFVVVRRPAPGQGGGSGVLTIDNVRHDRAAGWPREEQRGFACTTETRPARRAIEYLLGRQTPRGLFRTEAEQGTGRAHLRDQALVLRALARAGSWESAVPLNEAARSAGRLVAFLAGVQKPDGRFATSFDAQSGAEASTPERIGDQAWMTLALAAYSRAAADPVAATLASNAASGLAGQVAGDGRVAPETAQTAEVWWAMRANGRGAEAERIQTYLLGGSVWDPQLRYLWRGEADPKVALEPAARLAEITRHPLVQRPELGLAALSFVRRALLAQSGTHCGLDGMGPVSVWFEGLAQYVVAGGPDAQVFLDRLLKWQNPNGSLAGAAENWHSSFGTLTTSSSTAATAWLYFALTGSPFEGF